MKRPGFVHNTVSPLAAFSREENVRAEGLNANGPASSRETGMNIHNADLHVLEGQANDLQSPCGGLYQGRALPPRHNVINALQTYLFPILTPRQIQEQPSDPQDYSAILRRSLQTSQAMLGPDAPSDVPPDVPMRTQAQPLQFEEPLFGTYDRGSIRNSPSRSIENQQNLSGLEILSSDPQFNLMLHDCLYRLQTTEPPARSEDFLTHIRNSSSEIQRVRLIFEHIKLSMRAFFTPEEALKAQNTNSALVQEFISLINKENFMDKYKDMFFSNIKKSIHLKKLFMDVFHKNDDFLLNSFIPAHVLRILLRFNYLYTLSSLKKNILIQDYIEASSQDLQHIDTLIGSRMFKDFPPSSEASASHVSRNEEVNSLFEPEPQNPGRPSINPSGNSRFTLQPFQLKQEIRQFNREVFNKTLRQMRLRECEDIGLSIPESHSAHDVAQDHALLFGSNLDDLPSPIATLFDFITRARTFFHLWFPNLGHYYLTHPTTTWKIIGRYLASNRRVASHAQNPVQSLVPGRANRAIAHNIDSMFPEPLELIDDESVISGPYDETSGGKSYSLEH